MNRRGFACVQEVKHDIMKAFIGITFDKFKNCFEVFLKGLDKYISTGGRDTSKEPYFNFYFKLNRFYKYIQLFWVPPCTKCVR